MTLKKEYIITKISDQKEKFYQTICELEVGENNLPTEGNLDKLINIENPKKSVALFIGNDYITKICFKSISKFNKNILEEYEKGYEEELYLKVYYKTSEKNASFLNWCFQKIKEESSYQTIRNNKKAPQRG